MSKQLTLGAVTDAAASSSGRFSASELAGCVAADQARAKRLEAAMSVNGMWRGQSDKPQDGLECQREVRAEWQ